MNVVDLGVSENYGTVCLHASGVERVTAKLDSHHSALDLFSAGLVPHSI